MKNDAISRLLVLAGICLLTTAACGQSASTAPVAGETTEHGFIVHQSADLGGHMANLTGSGAMYNTLVNIQSGPRVLGETFTLRALETNKHPLFDSLTATSNGFGGDPNNFAKLDFSKGKVYEFSALFRRDRQYFDYDLLGNPSIPAGMTIPYGLVNGVPTAASLAWPQVMQSPVMFNTVRRMTDTNLTILPLAKVSYHIGYSKNIFQGPTLSPGRSIGKFDALLNEYQRNNTDEFTGSIDWKPLPLTKITIEEQVNHYKADSYFTLASQDMIAQEADGTPVSIGSWYSTANNPAASPYTSSSCNTGSMGSSAYTNATNYTIFSAPQTPGGLPIINPACDVVTSYLRSQPTRVITPTETLRFQSSSIKNIAMAGDLRYTVASYNMPNYYENWTGLDGVAATKAGVTPAYPAQSIRSATFTGYASGQRQVISVDYGITWQATKTLSLADQIDYSSTHQPGRTNISAGITQNTSTDPNQTINYSGALGSGSTFTVSGNPNGTEQYGYFGQKYVTNNATVSWEASTRATLALTYRYKTHTIGEGIPDFGLLAVGATPTSSGAITINENAGIFNAALRPTRLLQMNGTVEIAYDDNAFTPVAPRQMKRYRFHTTYKPKTWLSVTGAYTDLERHNNTNNTDTPSVDGPLNHVDHSRTVSTSVVASPNEHYSLDVSYSYSDVYTSTNACITTATTTSTLPGVDTGVGCPNTAGYFLAKDFMDAPTQYASIAVTYSPNKVIRTAAGYRISAVSGNQLFDDAQQVNGSLQSAYQTPFVNVAWTVHPGLVWRAEYNYFGYGEGGPSGAPLCSSAAPTGTLTSIVLPASFSCSTNANGPTGLTEPSSGLSAPRNFHSNNVTLAMHYSF